VCMEVAAGNPTQDIMASVPLDEFLPAGLDRDKHGMERRHRMVVEKLVAEETEASRHTPDRSAGAQGSAEAAERTEAP
jgi:hypothetical protein